MVLMASKNDDWAGMTMDGGQEMIGCVPANRKEEETCQEENLMHEASHLDAKTERLNKHFGLEFLNHDGSRQTFGEWK